MRVSVYANVCLPPTMQLKKHIHMQTHSMAGGRREHDNRPLKKVLTLAVFERPHRTITHTYAHMSRYITQKVLKEQLDWVRTPVNNIVCECTIVVLQFAL